MTLRTRHRKSRNLMTVRIAKHIGMDKIVATAKRFGIATTCSRYLPMALGAGETTLMRMVIAYLDVRQWRPPCSRA